MRRESSTVVALVGEVTSGLLAGLGRSGNVSVGPAPAAGPAGPEPGPVPSPGSGSVRPGSGPVRPGWEPGAQAMREAARRHAPYVVVPADPLAGVAAAWRSMWDVAEGPGAAAQFEDQAAQALAAWHGKQFELPDYYLVVAPVQPGGTGADLYLGPLRAARARRVAVAAVGSEPGQTGRVLDALRGLEHGPWWPPLDELIDTARHFYAGGLAETQPPAA